MKARLIKLIDVKSIITLALVATLVLVMLSGKGVEDKLFNLFSNIISMVMAYFFAKDKKREE